jgi:hypothetical protein
MTPKETLIARGTRLLAPESIFIDEDVVPEQIAADATIHPGCRIRGGETWIGPGSIIGEQGPATVNNCQLGRNVELAGGYFDRATLLDGATAGNESHIRPGCLFEEAASCAHAVGMKQTMLMAYMTLGSTINFCDCLMYGGRNAREHSEVGSSYIHFNFTAHQDKATPSLFGDVPRGVMLDQPPIFLGGQGGIVGPIRVEYGTIIAAGIVYRRDILECGQLVSGANGSRFRHSSYDTDVYGKIDRILTNNCIYIGNLHALRAWYRLVRLRFMQDPFAAACHAGAMVQIDRMIAERLKQLDRLAEKIHRSITISLERGTPADKEPLLSHQRFLDTWDRQRAALNTWEEAEGELQASFLTAFASAPVGNDYLATIHALPPATRQLGTDWLQAIVDRVAIPSPPPFD